MKQQSLMLIPMAMDDPKPSTSADSFKCVLCNKKFSDQKELQSHFRSHASDKSLKSSKRVVYPKKSTEVNQKSTIKCDVCGAEFSNNSAAISHKFRKHPNDPNKNHCTMCGMSFPLKAFLDRHVENHPTPVHPKVETPCEVCGAVFDNLQARTYHSSTNHQRVMKLFQPIVTAPPSNKVKVNNAGELQSVYFCHLCGTEYIIKFNLQKHLEVFHTTEERSRTPTEMIRCTACDALFYNRKAYENHNLGHKPDDLYVTDEKQRLQLVRRVDQDFDMRRVQPLADKYVPSYKKKRKTLYPNLRAAREDGDCSDGSISPPSSPDTSDSDDVPLRQKSAA